MTKYYDIIVDGPKGGSVSGDVQERAKDGFMLNPELLNDAVCDVVQNTCQLLNGIKPDAVQENWWSEWDEAVLQSLIRVLKSTQKYYGKEAPKEVTDKAEVWARWYANEGSYQDWLKLPTSPFGKEGDFAKTLRVAKAAYLAGHAGASGMKWVKVGHGSFPNDPNEKVFRRKLRGIYQYIQTEDFYPEHLVFNGEEIPYSRLEYLDESGASDMKGEVETFKDAYIERNDRVNELQAENERLREALLDIANMTAGKEGNGLVIYCNERANKELNKPQQ